MIRLLLGLALAALAVPAEARPLWLVDFVYVAEGQGLAEHDAYTEDGAHIAARHGVRLAVRLDRVPGFAHPGPIAPDRIDVWSVPDAAALKAWQDDIDRVWFEDLSGHILAAQSSRYRADRSTVAAIRPDRLYLVDILQFGPGTDGAAADDWAAALDASHGRHGLAAAGGLDGIAHLSGPYGRVDRLILTLVPDMAALDGLLADRGFHAAAGRFGALFGSDGSTRQLFRARGLPGR